MNNKQIESELRFGFKIGPLVGIFLGIFALLILNVWYILPPIGAPDIWAAIVIWIGVGFSPVVLLYKPLDLRLYRPKSQAFFIGMIMTIGLISCVYNAITAYNILPYSSLETIPVVMFVMFGTFIGFTIKTIVEPRIAKTKETVQ
ncbi:MAG: hypothetical protein KAQ64_00390 [Candidatus Pacebacteria bacterium]|nr:hypothetical protein [Candidatus Paceibacterota bacterium]